MDPRTLDYYNKELTYMREMAAEFAHQHPKIAKRLGMQGIEIADPYVERMIEAFCFLSARTQIKLDAEFPRFTQRLLEVIYLNYVTPTPSMAVAQLHPSHTEGDFSHGFPVPRDSTFYAKVPLGEETVCEFRSSQDVTLWPIKIVEARLTGTPPDLSTLERYLPAHIQVKGALRLHVRSENEITFAQIKGLDRLPIYLCGEERIASHLFELLHTSAVATLTGEPGQFSGALDINTQAAIVHEALQPGQGLLPLSWNVFHGHNLLHEYFSCPTRFYFFTPTGLAAGFSRINGKEAGIVVLLNKMPSDWLINQTNAQQFALHCTPIINLFPKRTDRIELDTALTELHLVPNRSHPLDYEIFSVEKIDALQAQTTQELTFRPLYHTLNDDEGNYGRYFSLRRERRKPSDNTRKYGTRTPYIGTEVFVSLVDQHEAPYSEDIRYLSVQAWLTNRDLPTLVPRNGQDDLSVAESVPVERIGLIRPPSPPMAPFAERELAWRLIRQLSFNYLPLNDMAHRPGGQSLRDLLRLFIPAHDSPQMRQIESLIGCQTGPVTRRLPSTGPLVYGHGVKCQLTIDEEGFSGISPYLFGLILEHYLARHVAINVFTQTELHSMQRGLVERWPVRMGSRGVV